MEKKPLAVLLFVAIIALFLFNPGFRKHNRQYGREISAYQYAQLHAAVNRYPEIADTAHEELTGQSVSLSQYNEIMRKVDQIRLKQANQVATQTASLLTDRQAAKN